MKANELMIGITVMDVQSNKPVTVDEHVIAECMNGMDFYCGIPLTAEWLERFGFVRTATPIMFEGKKVSDMIDYRKGNMVTYGSPDFYEIEYCKLDIEGRTYIARINHVHQLQTLFYALTGTELTLKQ